MINKLRDTENNVKQSLIKYDKKKETNCNCNVMLVNQQKLILEAHIQRKIIIHFHSPLKEHFDEAQRLNKLHALARRLHVRLHNLLHEYDNST